jgi:dipeptidyl aminopeptidase/acylaminoacyl peptidase
MVRNCLIALAFLAAAPTQALAEAARAPLSAEAMWGLARIGDPQLSPDGRWAVAPVTRFDLKENKGLTDLYLFPTDGGAPRQLTADLASDGEARFSPDGKWVAFVSKRGDDKQSQVYVIPVDGGEARRVTNVPTGAMAPRWMPDSNSIVFLSRIWASLPDWEAQGKRLKERDETKMTARVWDAAPFSYWDRWVDDREVHAFVIALSGGEPRAITREAGVGINFRDAGAGSYDVSPDGKEIAFEAETGKGNLSNYDVFTVAIEGGPARNLTPDNPAGDGAPQYSPDGRFLAFTQQKIVGFYADRARLMLYDRRTSATRNITPNFDRSASGLVWAPDSRSLYGAIDDAATRRVYRFDINGAAPRRITNRMDHTGLAVANGRMVAIVQSFDDPPDLARIDLNTGRAGVLSRFNDEAWSRVAPARTESVTYKGANGKDIQMWVTYPPNFDASKKWPVFLVIHGGPHNAVTDQFFWRWNAQVFAGWGYVVAWHNFHGSSGFGQDFADSINPDWATLPYADTIAAADWFKAKPWTDQARMVAGGGSYGGYLASVLLGREHPFQALIAHAAVYNLYSHVATDGGALPSRFLEYWQDQKAFDARSPHTAAAHFKTPTLVIHGQNDLRVNVNHGFELFNVLQRKGVESRLVYYPNENHWILQPQNSVFWYSQVEDWVKKYAPPGPR